MTIATNNATLAKDSVKASLADVDADVLQQIKITPAAIIKMAIGVAKKSIFTYRELASIARKDYDEVKAFYFQACRKRLLEAKHKKALTIFEKLKQEYPRVE